MCLGRAAMVSLGSCVAAADAWLGWMSDCCLGFSLLVVALIAFMVVLWLALVVLGCH